jgi:hypothetical protein
MDGWDVSFYNIFAALMLRSSDFLPSWCSRSLQSSRHQNTIHVIIAGVVSTWWFAPDDASSFCSSAIKDSFVRATTTSFGSICFGSLLVAIIETLTAIVESARSDTENGGCAAFLLCIVDCLLRCMEGMLEYFNKFAYIYIGMVSIDPCGGHSSITGCSVG